jgi:hypothetical protein
MTSVGLAQKEKYKILKEKGNKEKGSEIEGLRCPLRLPNPRAGPVSVYFMYPLCITLASVTMYQATMWWCRRPFQASEQDLAAKPTPGIVPRARGSKGAPRND